MKKIKENYVGKEKQKEAKECNDKKCPTHGKISLRGRVFYGVIVSKDAHRTAVVEWPRIVKIKKYERFEKRRSKVKAHNPSCINAGLGEMVKIVECRPLSKTKNFVIVERIEK